MAALWDTPGHDSKFTPAQWADAIKYGAQASDKVASKYFSIMDGSEVMAYAGAPRSYAISPVGNAVRFELRTGDKNFWDWQSNHACDRAEFQTRLDPLIVPLQPFGYTITPTFEKGDKNTSPWLVWWQMHQSNQLAPFISGSPPLAFELLGERFVIHARAGKSGVDGATGNKIVVTWKDTIDIVRGKPDTFTIRGMFHKISGVLKIWKNGVLIVEYYGPFGFDDLPGVYMSKGLYRYPSPETMAVQINTTWKYIDPLVL